MSDTKKIKDPRSRQARIGTPLEYLRQIKVELQKVKWPSHRQAVNLTLIVVFVSLAVGLYISGLDVIFTEFVKSIIN